MASGSGNAPQQDAAKPQGGQTDGSSAKPQADNRPQLGALIEDDEFEEFPTEDWDDSEADFSSLVKGGAADGTVKKKVTMEDLWEDNWDDDVIDSDFAQQLRHEISLVKKANEAGGPAPMQT